MVSQTHVTHPQGEAVSGATSERVYQEGLVAGAIGGATVAVWFFLVDLMAGQPLQTPSLLGTALLRGPSALSGGEVPIDLEMVIVFTWVHFLAFGLIGGIAAKLLSAVEREPNFGFGVVLLLVVFEFGFIAVTMIFAEEVLQAMAWPAILVGNTFAAAAMAYYFRRRHPQLTILP